MAKKANLKLIAKYFPQKERREKIDTTVNSDYFRRDNNILQDAFTAWTALDEFRRKARRNKKYTFEDQWSDTVVVEGKAITERKNILNQGNIPLQNNRIRGIVRSVCGVFQSAQTEPVCVSRDRDEQSKGEMMSATLQYVYQNNRLWSLDSSNFQYLLVTGLAVFKSVYGYRNGRQDVWTDLVNYNDFFVDSHMKDPRHLDCHLVGQLHDKSLHQVMAQFADGSPEKARRIRNLYGYANAERTIEHALENLVEDANRHKDFFIPSDSSQCRVIEVWKKEYKERYLVHDTLTGELYKVEIGEIEDVITTNRIRKQEQAASGVEPANMRLLKYKWIIDDPWCFYFMTPQGDILKQGETPYWHESHPYSFKIYPFFDGQVFPFVGDFIDQQRYINRLITLQDFVMRASAKGVLLFPEDSLPDGYTMDDISDDWSAYNGVIAYKPAAHGKIPQQIMSNSSQTGVYDMLSIQLKLLEDISGVQGALQGQAPSSGTPAALYMQQTQNSATSLMELYEANRELREERDKKNMQLVQQSYDDIRYVNIVGNGISRKDVIYNPELVKNVEFDLSITESTATPAYRLVMNDFLMQLFQSQQIDVEQLLENGAFPFADKLLQSIKSRKEQSEQAQQAMMQGGQVNPTPQGMVDPNIQAEIMANTNPLVQRMLADEKEIA